MPDLLVTRPFGDYAVGDRIALAETADAVRASGNVHHTVPVPPLAEPETFAAKAATRRAPKEG